MRDPRRASSIRWKAKRGFKRPATNSREAAFLPDTPQISGSPITDTSADLTPCEHPWRVSIEEKIRDPGRASSIRWQVRGGFERPATTSREAAFLPDSPQI